MKIHYVMNEKQIPVWREICNQYAKKINAKLLFVNEESFGVEMSDGSIRHIYIDELQEILSKN